ncbi:Zinc finger BED domain-containing protein RICESLEEPER 2 [Nymphaea thermarum]|nr:Zinc finger BED domain-containing protein RICESLEEPER 2 [Nymphaea thermarum]
MAMQAGHGCGTITGHIQRVPGPIRARVRALKFSIGRPSSCARPGPARPDRITGWVRVINSARWDPFGRAWHCDSAKFRNFRLVGKRERAEPPPPSPHRRLSATAIVDVRSTTQFLCLLQWLIHSNARHGTARKTLTKEVQSMFKTEKMRYQGHLNNHVQRVSLTFDMWSSQQTLGYLCLTAKYIDTNWQLHSHILNFVHVPPPHNASSICDILLECITTN